VLNTSPRVLMSFAKEPYKRDNILRKRPILTYIYHIFVIDPSGGGGGGWGWVVVRVVGAHKWYVYILCGMLRFAV